MAADAQVSLVGNLTREPKLEFTAGGSALLKLSMACNRKWKKGDEWQEEVSFFNVVCWTELAENVAASVMKGDRVLVIGRLQQRSWVSETDEKRSVVEVVADDVALSLRYATGSTQRIARSAVTPAAQKQTQSDNAFFGHDEPF